MANMAAVAMETERRLRLLKGSPTEGKGTSSNGESKRQQHAEGGAHRKLKGSKKSMQAGYSRWSRCGLVGPVWERWHECKKVCVHHGVTVPPSETSSTGDCRRGSGLT